MTEIDNILKQLQPVLKQFEISKKALDQISVDLIRKLPSDKRAGANAIMRRARKGKVDVNEIINFAGNMRKEDEESLKKSVEMVHKKEEEVNGKK